MCLSKIVEGSGTNKIAFKFFSFNGYSLSSPCFHPYHFYKLGDLVISDRELTPLDPNELFWKEVNRGIHCSLAGQPCLMAAAAFLWHAVDKSFVVTKGVGIGEVAIGSFAEHNFDLRSQAVFMQYRIEEICEVIHGKDSRHRGLSLEDVKKALQKNHEEHCKT